MLADELDDELCAPIAVPVIAHCVPSSAICPSPLAIPLPALPVLVQVVLVVDDLQVDPVDRLRLRAAA